MKKIFVSIFLLGISSLLGVCMGISNKNIEEYGTCYSVKYMEFDELLESADVVLNGKVKKIVKCDTYDEYYIDVHSVEKGLTDKQIVVRNIPCSYTYEYDGVEYCGNSNMNYQENKEYLFILQHIDSVYESAYYILGDAYIPLESSQNSTYLSRNFSNIDNVLSYIEEYNFVKKDGEGATLTIPYIESDEIVDIVTESMYIVSVKPNVLYHTTEIIDVYLCDVLHTYKGDINTTEDKKIIISFFKDSVNIGEEYIVCLNSDTSDSLVYALSSKNSVVDTIREETVKEILERK